jgi:hypothetical protein
MGKFLFLNKFGFCVLEKMTFGPKGNLQENNQEPTKNPSVFQHVNSRHWHHKKANA